MSKTILITGASSGIGKETARRFQAEGWNVVATMRRPEAETELNGLDDVLVIKLDVTEPETITAAVAAGIERFDTVDALLNNAGYGAYGILEATPMENIRRQFDVNVIGLFETTKAVLPHFRARGEGVVVNVSSMGGKVAFPLGSLYHGTKFAVEGLSEALSFELAPVGVKVKLVEPGIIKTDFGGRSLDVNVDEGMTEYGETVAKVFGALENTAGGGSEASLVADVIWNAVTDGTDTLRYVAGEDAEQLIAMRKAADDEAYLQGIRDQFGL